MAQIIELSSLSSQTVERSQWTAVIPAAGKGSRLGVSLPKILYPLLGRPLLDWLLDILRPVCKHFIFVLSPSGQPVLEPLLEARLGETYSVVIQEHPTGMGDAVLLSAAMVKTPYTLVIWGDQVTLQPATVLACAAEHQARSNVVLTLPTVIKKNAYIHFERDVTGKITTVLQHRENEIHTEFGENDCGLFLFSTTELFKVLAIAKQEGIGVGKSTGEFNLLQVIPSFETNYQTVLTVRLSDPFESLGINTPEEALLIADEMRRRQRVIKYSPYAPPPPTPPW